jgi:hypothetical protein
MPRQKRAFSGDAKTTYQLAHQQPILNTRVDCEWKKIKVHYWSQVHKFGPQPPRMEAVFSLPTSPTCHLRGFLASREIYYRKGDQDNYWPLRFPKTTKDRPKYVIFHSQPTECIYSEVPAREDIYWFIKFPHRVLMTVGRKRIGIFRKDKRTEALAARLKSWEQQNRYRIFRIQTRHPSESPEQHFRRYASAALRAMDLEWPGKRSKRRKLWPHVLEQLGLVVTAIDR